MRLGECVGDVCSVVSSDDPVKGICEVRTVPVGAGVAKPHVVDLGRQRTRLVGRIRLIEKRLKQFPRVCAIEIDIDRFSLRELRQTRIPCRRLIPVQRAIRRRETEHAQTTVAHWCWGKTESSVGKQVITSLPEKT